jgi:hypothetical protein
VRGHAARFRFLDDRGRLHDEFRRTCRPSLG